MKRILSFILSVCMIISLIPALSASAEEEAAYQLVYDFRNVDEFENRGVMDTSKVKFTTTDGTFEFHSTNSSKITYRNSYIEIQEGDGVYFAVVLNVPYSGTFSAKLSYYQYDNTASNSKLQNTEGDVYLLKDTVTDVSKATTEDRVSDIATAVVYGKPDSESAGETEITSDEDITLSAGKYILVFEQTQRNGGSSGQRMRPITLTLTSGSGDAYATVPAYINKANVAKTNLEMNESTSYEFSGWMNDYSAFDEASANVTVTSKNDCVSIDTSAKSITAVKSGDDVITFSVSNGGKTITKQVEISVVGNSGDADEPGGDEDEGEDVRYEYNLNLGIENHTNTTGYAATAVTDYATSKDMWIYFAKTAGTAYGYAKKYIEIKSDVGEYFAIKMKVPSDGTYDVSLTQYLHATNGGYIDLYLLPGDTAKADIPDLLVDDNKLNEEAIRGFAAANTQDNVVEVTKKHNIAAGEYVLVFHAASLGDNGNGTTAWMYPGLITLSSAANDSTQEEAEAAFNATETPATDYVESTVTGLTTDSTIEAVKNSNGTFTLTASETKNDAKFLYWAKGMSKNKKIVSFSNELSNYMPEENGRNFLIAVYEDDITDKTEYYNANGQLLPDATENDHPYMAGYGKASGWSKYGDTNIYVAQYDKTEPGVVTVTVENGSGSATVSYGTAVTCRADDTKGTFLWWQKDVNGKTEIVSVTKNYTFLAYKDCTVTAVYGDEAVSVAKPAKIVIDLFGRNNVMAEFIGFGSNVVEKGIMFNDMKIAMTSPGNQFTITADANGTYKGYAIIKDGSGYTLVTDGDTNVVIAE